MSALGEGVDFVIGGEGETRPKPGKARERRWQRDLRQGRYGAALDGVLDPAAKDRSPLNVLTLLVALRHRGALRDALEGRDEATVQPVLRWVCAHVIDPRYVSVCVDVGLHLLDLYAEFVGGSAELADGFRLLRRRVSREVERSQIACQTGGMVQSLIMSGAA
ncbi:putative u3 small nucleolar rna-associated protein 15 protein [Phaeoacremonium minimum UCRPA7]|uniref:Putative u3 small nucleolar rna-associated protein 15 protein n=1 Tax=Phaeoacremonium minimum (strain UCR-PA7) TaxID=1286976 RepID=R8BU51_PHAM7|nr:putative u3 small nucleolar rna-associated protein 15 protein [Phaeoacremonium minimum UCRPA7]EOO02903.1 putative u3 small nucleolar rna-associated protein 15 protein [Phaeoacremonium minimum UCRPA7]